MTAPRTFLDDPGIAKAFGLPPAAPVDVTATKPADPVADKLAVMDANTRRHLAIAARAIFQRPTSAEDPGYASGSWGEVDRALNRTADPEADRAFTQSYDNLAHVDAKAAANAAANAAYKKNKRT